MNPTISNLQQQFPLSPRKFWKKLFQATSGWIFLALLAIIFDIIAIYLTATSSNPQNSAIFGFVLFLIILFFLIIVSIYAWYIKTYIKRYYYAGEENFITIKKGVFAPAEIHVQWQKIQDVYVDQDIVDRIMGLYDVHIASATAASGIEAHIDGLDQTAAEAIKNFLLDKVSNAGRGIQNNIPNNVEQSQTQPAPQTQPKTVNFSEEISNTKYPLQGKWIGMKVITSIISPFIYWALIAIIFFAKSSTEFSAENVVRYFVYYFAISCVSAAFHLVSFFLWKKNYAFNFTADNIYFRQGVIALSEKHMPYSSVQDVTVQQGFIERLLGLGKVRIENAAQMTMQTRDGKTASIFNGVLLQGLSITDANHITDILKTTVLGRNTSQYGL